MVALFKVVLHGEADTAMYQCHIENAEKEKLQRMLVWQGLRILTTFTGKNLPYLKVETESSRSSEDGLKLAHPGENSKVAP
jgi:hypothetical protein